MKIALVVHDFLGGVGHGRYAIELARNFSRDHDLHVLANRFEDGLDFRYHRHFVHAWRGSALSAALTFPGAAQKIIDRERFDVVHAQGFACQRANVITAHVCNAARYKRDPAHGWRKRLFPFFVIPRERAFYKRAKDSQVIALSRVAQRELASEYQVQGATVIYHGIDTEKFKSAGPKAGLSRWLFVGEAVKGLGTVIEALKYFPEAHLQVVTRSPPAGWKDLAARKGFSSRISFLGAMENVAPAYQAADLFIYPSPYDTFGMVVAEAMSSGLPVIASREIGAAEWIEEGVNGFLCDPANVNSILEQIRTIHTLPPDRLNGICAAARATAKRHTWNDCARSSFEVYQRAIANNCVSK